jgi:hypothetical protein
VRSALAGTFEEFELSEDAGALVVQFTRAIDDDLLDSSIRALQIAGGRIISCAAERATLLDVLERFEREHETIEEKQS